jgi:hypothetical protein
MKLWICEVVKNKYLLVGKILENVYSLENDSKNICWLKENFKCYMTNHIARMETLNCFEELTSIN